MSNEVLILCSDGTGVFAEANMGPYCSELISWYVEDDILTIYSNYFALCHNPIHYERDIVVPCMSIAEKHFTGLIGAACGLDFYREIEDRTPEQAETEAQSGIDFLREFSCFF